MLGFYVEFSPVLWQSLPSILYTSPWYDLSFFTVPLWHRYLLTDVRCLVLSLSREELLEELKFGLSKSPYPSHKPTSDDGT